MHVVALCSFPVAVAGLLTASRVFPALPGFEEFGGAGDALAILAIAAPCIFFGTVLSAAYKKDLPNFTSPDAWRKTFAANSGSGADQQKPGQ